MSFLNQANINKQRKNQNLPSHCLQQTISTFAIAFEGKRCFQRSRSPLLPPILLLPAGVVAASTYVVFKSKIILHKKNQCTQRGILKTRNLPGLGAAFVVLSVFPGVATETLLLAVGAAIGVSTGFGDSTTAPVAA
jgi:hypothetical protein